MKLFIEMMELGLLPDWLVMLGIKGVCLERILEERAPSMEVERAALVEFVHKLRTMPVAVETAKANEQHYEVPAEFFTAVLGPRKKYSSAIYPNGDESLGEAEDKMLALTCARAGIADGMDILELGCGWGSLTLWMAEKYPNSRITAVSNSASQREYIEGEAKLRGFSNVKIVTADVNHLTIDGKFDHVVSVEMFEHMRNYKLLMQKIASALKPSGKLFVHIFCHKKFAYEYKTEGNTNWLGRYFFTGGIMPSEDLLLFFQDDLLIENHWRVNGMHYSKTSRDWKRNIIARRAEVMEILRKAYGAHNAGRWFERWKVFFMACEALFGFRGGNEWYVSHYLFSKR